MGQNKNYIQGIRSKVGHDKIILTFAGGCIFNDKGEVLLQRRGDTNLWGFPGGAVELGETPQMAASREIKEETGLDVEAGRVIGVYSDLDITYSSGDRAQSIVIAFELKPVGGELCCDFKETMELRYFSKEEKPKLFTKSHEDLWNEIFPESGLQNNVRELQGANMDIDLTSENIGWNQMGCPWNEAENTTVHKCAVKNISICQYFCGVKYLDSVLCSYPHGNKNGGKRVGKIKIEPFRMEYLEDYYNAFTEEITKYQWPDPFESLTDAKELLQSFLDEAEKGETILLSALSEDGEFIGSSEVHGLSEECSEVGVWIKASEWNKGYAYEALKAALDLARDKYGKTEFFYEADVRNIGSMKLLRKFEADYEIIEQGIEKITTDSGKELELKGFVLKAREL